MTNAVSFMSANFVARETGYALTGGWMQGDRAANDFFRPLATFPERFGGLLDEISALGFTAVDIWSAHLNWNWATAEHIAAARALLAEHQLEVVSLAGNFGSTRPEFEAACRLAVALGAARLGGDSSLLATDRAFVVATLHALGLQLGIENHPEKNARELLDRIGDGGHGTIGAALDTGSFATLGYDAARAVTELAGQLVHVHLRDVVAPGSHASCAFGHGCVPLEACVRNLRHIGYAGPISVEHNPETFDPSEDCRASLALLRAWLAAPSKEVALA
jgi:L-ribulose-5-phosphate 3-epimerase